MSATVAAAIATTPETLSRVLARLDVDGTLSWVGATIRVDADAWARLTGDDD